MATILDPQTIGAILLSLGLPTEIPERAPPARAASMAPEALPSASA
jgi:hypothetical protein